MINHDKLFKELLKVFFVEFLELVAPELAVCLDRRSLVFLDKEMINDTAGRKVLIADLVVKAQFRGSGAFVLIHLEPQGKRQREYAQRLFFYFSRLHEGYRLPVYPIAVFYHDSTAREPECYEVWVRDKRVLRFDYQVVQLSRMNWRSYVKQPNPVACALMAKMRIKAQDRPHVKLECLRLLATLKIDPARTRLISGFIDTYLKLNAKEELLFLREADTLREEKVKVMEIVTSWMAEGIRKGRKEGILKGRQQGLKEGRQEGRQAVVLRLVRRRCGAIGHETEARVCALDADRLEKLSEDLLDFSSISDLNAWLDR